MNNFNLKIKIKTICRWQILSIKLSQFQDLKKKIKNLKISKK